MILSKVKESLKTLKTIGFKLPDGRLVPPYFHVTEVGVVSKDFIDCGGAVRSEKVVNFQLWESTDYDHRLHPDKLLKIIELSEKVLNIGDYEIEVEYQGPTIGKYGLEFDGTHFLLTSKLTACLAEDESSCGRPQEKARVKLSDLNKEEESSCCSPESGCC